MHTLFPREPVQYLQAYPTCSSAMWPCHSLAKRWRLSPWPWIWMSSVIALNNRSEAVPVWDTALNWPSVFCSLPLGSQLPCKKYTCSQETTLWETQGTSRGAGGWDAMWVQRGAKEATRQRRVSEEAILEVESVIPGTLLDAMQIRNKLPSWPLLRFLTHKTVSKTRWLF